MESNKEFVCLWTVLWKTITPPQRIMLLRHELYLLGVVNHSVLLQPTEAIVIEYTTPGMASSDYHLFNRSVALSILWRSIKLHQFVNGLEWLFDLYASENLGKIVANDGKYGESNIYIYK